MPHRTTRQEKKKPTNKTVSIIHLKIKNKEQINEEKSVDKW